MKRAAQYEKPRVCVGRMGCVYTHIWICSNNIKAVRHRLGGFPPQRIPGSSVRSPFFPDELSVFFVDAAAPGTKSNGIIRPPRRCMNMCVCVCVCVPLAPPIDVR